MHSTPPTTRVSVDEHQARVSELLNPLRSYESESVALDEALGRLLVDAVLAPVALPPFRNSQMDGFAVRAAETGNGRPIPIVGTIAAGSGEPPPLAIGTTMRIMTGAPLPAGADAVIPVENASVDGGDGQGAITTTRPIEVGAYVREAGSDVVAGAELVAASTLLAPRHIAALAAGGLGSVVVRRRIRLAIITTGAEVVAAGRALAPGEIFDANGPALAAAAHAAGAEVVARARTSDDRNDFERALERAAALADVIVTAGGISQGEFEVVREVVEPRGAWVGSVALQPGGPQATATVDGVPVLSFPGNPVSAQLSFELFLAPFLREAAGLPARVTESRELASDLESVAGKVQLVRARAHGPRGVVPVSGPGSHLVAAMAAADRIIVVPAETTRLPAGTEVTAWVL